MKKLPILFITLTLLLILGCSIKEPGSPKWQVEVTIPVADRVYSLSEIVDDSSEVADNDSLGNWISQSGDTMLIFNFADTIQQMVNNDSLTIEPVYETMQDYVGVLTVNAPGTGISLFLFQEINPDLTQGNYVITEQYEIDHLQEALEPYPEFEWAILQSGQMKITLTNNLPIPLIDITISVINNNQFSNLVYQETFAGTIEVGESRDVTGDLLAGQSIENQLLVDIYGRTGVSDGVVLVDPATDHVHIDVEILPLEITSALAEFPGQPFDLDTTFTAESDHSIISAEFQTAYLDYTIYNDTQLYNEITFSIPSLVDSVGEHFSATIELPPEDGIQVLGVDLSGYTFRPKHRTTRFPLI